MGMVFQGGALFDSLTVGENLAFRLVARSCGGVGLVCTDLLCPDGVLRENKRSMELAATCPEDWPLAMQLYGGDVQKLCDAAVWAEDHGAGLETAVGEQDVAGPGAHRRVGGGDLVPLAA